MVGIVVVSHSAGLADGVVELAREMGGEEVRIEAAGGMAEPRGAIGTDPMVVRAAIERVAGPDGVLVLMDLGSALMSAEMAVELLEDMDERVLLCPAPLVEGAVAAAARARIGATLDEVAAEARGALAPKVAQLGGEARAVAAPDGADVAPADGEELRLTVTNPLGLHARPAARFIATATRFDADVSVENATTGAGPGSARSLTALATLAVRQGHEVIVRARGPQAAETLAALRALADENFGDEPTATAPSASTDEASTVDVGYSSLDGLGEGAVLRGIGASPGVVLGPARRLALADLDVGDDESASEPRDEGRRLDAARTAARRDLERARDVVSVRAGAAEAAIFDAHLLLLDDEAIVDPAHRAIEDGRSAAHAWQDAVDGAADAFAALDDELLRARAVDVRDVGRRVLGHLLGAPAQPTLREAGVVVATDLTPGQTAALDRALVQGIATARGTGTSHAAILARGLGIPAVVGLGDALLGVADGTPVALDGERGDLLVAPNPEEQAAYEERSAVAERERLAARAQAALPAVTRDGVGVRVEANLGGPDDVAAALAEGAEGVGLLRTEFLFGNRPTLPDEDEQAATYRAIAAALDGRPLVVRTLDVGADKPLAAMPQPPEANPFLGRRGIRLALAEPELLRVQLRALVRASSHEPAMKVLLPMVTTLDELRQVRTLLDEACRALEVSDRPALGIMVEVPATAVAADRFAPEVDFFSVGTNDLAQYTMAAERGNEHVAALAAGPVPAVLRLVAHVTAAGAAHDRPVAVCGELAGDVDAAVLLAGLGVRELSMAPPRIPAVKARLRAIELADASRAARAALDCDTAEQARALAAGVPGR